MEDISLDFSDHSDGAKFLTLRTSRLKRRFGMLFRQGRNPGVSQPLSNEFCRRRYLEKNGPPMVEKAAVADGVCCSCVIRCIAAQQVRYIHLDHCEMTVNIERGTVSRSISLPRRN